jgi:hypothetical protein
MPTCAIMLVLNSDIAADAAVAGTAAYTAGSQAPQNGHQVSPRLY